MRLKIGKPRSWRLTSWTVDNINIAKGRDLKFKMRIKRDFPLNFYMWLNLAVVKIRTKKPFILQAIFFVIFLTFAHWKIRFFHEQKIHSKLKVNFYILKIIHAFLFAFFFCLFLASFILAKIILHHFSKLASDMKGEN